MTARLHHRFGLFVILLNVVLIGSTLAGCDQSVQPNPIASLSGKAVRYVPLYTTNGGKATATDYPLSAVDAQGNSTPITTLKEPDTDVPTPTLHIFAYGSGKLARLIPAAPISFPSQGHPVGSPAQIEVVDVNTGKATLYQAPPEIDPYMRDQTLFTTPLSPGGNQLIVPDRSSDSYYLLDLNSGHVAPIPNLKAFDIFGWSAADGLLYAHIIKLPSQGGGYVVERSSLQGKIEELNLPSGGSKDNIYDETLSPDGKQLYYETITSTQLMPPADPSDPIYPEMNVIERYDIASDSSAVVAHAAAGDYFSVGAGSFTLSSDGHAFAYVERKPDATGKDQPGGATIWRVDLSGSSQPVKIIAGLNNPFRLLWCNNDLYYYDGEPGWRGWHGMAVASGKPVRIAGEILGCAP